MVLKFSEATSWASEVAMRIGSIYFVFGAATLSLVAPLTIFSYVVMGKECVFLF